MGERPENMTAEERLPLVDPVCVCGHPAWRHQLKKGMCEGPTRFGRYVPFSDCRCIAFEVTR